MGHSPGGRGVQMGQGPTDVALPPCRPCLEQMALGSMARGQPRVHACVCARVCVCVLVRLSVTPRTIARQAPLSMGFSRQEYWGGLLFPSSRDLPDPGIEPGSPTLQADSLPSEPAEKPQVTDSKGSYLLLISILRVLSPFQTQSRVCCY